MFNERTGSLFNDLQYPTDVVMLVVLRRIQYKLSLHDLEEMFLVRGYAFSHETVRTWEAWTSGCAVFDEVRYYFRVRPALNQVLSFAQQ